MKNVKNVLLDECDLIKVKDASTVVMVKVKEIDMISNMYHVCRNKGFNDIKIHQIEIETWNINISNDIESNDSNNEDISSNRNVDLNKALDDFIQHVVEEKEVEKTPPKDPKVDDYKPHGFEKGPIYNNDDVTSRAGNEDVSFSMDQVKYNHTVIHKDMATNEVVSDNSKPPSFENFIKENKPCSRSSSTSRAGKKRKKRVWIKELCLKHNVHILGVQETKMSKLELFQLRSIWGNFKFDYHVIRVILFGDLNEVRSESERFRSTFSCGDATIFNSFIHDTGLNDLPMGGWHFTWLNKVGSKMRKLDRFLISDDVLYSNTDLK
ncbi:RNA-directed DNA polymerase, eukaryota, reverse transcriptase zinc-binding domain protein, partial [Tanacetum coccineum]